MNKYEVILDIFKDKILFLFKRYNHDNNKLSTLKNLSFCRLFHLLLLHDLLNLLLKMIRTRIISIWEKTSQIEKNQH